MSDENNESLGDELKDKANEIKEEAGEAFDSAKEKAAEAVDDTKEAAKDTVDDIKEGWNEATSGGENKKLIAGLLAIFLGSLGIHKFIMGYKKEGLILLIASIVGYVTMCIVVGFFILMATGIVGIIEGIIYLTKSDEEFYETYQVGKKPWF